MLIYFAGPLFSQAEKEFNIITKELEQTDFQVFLPQRDGIESTQGYSGLPKEEKRKALFEMDKKMILESDIFVFILDGRVPDEGACVELGIAYAQKDMTGKRNC